MVERDNWGSNPSVRAMRGLFSRMETAQNELIKRLRLFPFDRRLGYCREKARILFERAISSNRARAEGLDDEQSSSLYIPSACRGPWTEVEFGFRQGRSLKINGSAN